MSMEPIVPAATNCTTPRQQEPKLQIGVIYPLTQVQRDPAVVKAYAQGV
jgi:hypothetical protein